MARRNWRDWHRRFGRRLTETGGIVGIVGLALTAVGATVASPIVLIAGSVAAGGALIYSGVRAIPPRMSPATQNVGKNLRIEDLRSIHPPVLRLGVVGYTQAGKTTFIERALDRPGLATRTNRVYATVLALQTRPTKYVALLDADGHQYAQQFVVAENADFLIVFVDHNSGSDDLAISRERQDDHTRFLDQLQGCLTRRERPQRLHLLLNKRDLWEQSESTDQLLEWFWERVGHWQQANLAEEVTGDVHSNLDAGDISKTVHLISEGVENE